MKFLPSIFLAFVLLAPLASGAVDLGSVLGVETTPCGSTFADDNGDGVIDAADITTSIERPIVGVVEVWRSSIYRFGPAIGVRASFGHDLPTTFTRTVIVPPPGCFLPPETPVQRRIPPTTLDVGTSAVLTMEGVDFPLVVYPEAGGSWQLQQTYVRDSGGTSARLRFPGGADIAPFEFPIERHSRIMPQNPDLVLGPFAVNYRRFDLPLILNFDTESLPPDGIWQRIQLLRESSDELPGIFYEGHMPATGQSEIPPDIMAVIDRAPNRVRAMVTTIREHRFPVELADGTPAAVIIRYSNGDDYPYYIYPILHPVIETVSLNLGNPTTTRTDVALRFEANSHFTHHQIALDPDFTNTDWTGAVHPDIRPTYIESVVNIPATPGEYTVHIRIRNERGTSETVSATVEYFAPTPPQLTAVSLEDTSPVITYRYQWVNLGFVNEPTEYRISRSADFSEGTWTPLAPPTSDGVRRFRYSIPGPNGIVTLYVQLRNSVGDSDVMTTSFEMNAYGG